MPSICEICGRVEETEQLETDEDTLFMRHEVLHVCEGCLTDRREQLLR